jgi:hypothetical protein
MVQQVKGKRISGTCGMHERAKKFIKEFRQKISKEGVNWVA